MGGGLKTAINIHPSWSRSWSERGAERTGRPVCYAKEVTWHRCDVGEALSLCGSSVPANMAAWNASTTPLPALLLGVTGSSWGGTVPGDCVEASSGENNTICSRQDEDDIQPVDMSSTVAIIVPVSTLTSSNIFYSSFCIFFLIRRRFRSCSFQRHKIKLKFMFWVRIFPLTFHLWRR